MSRHHLIATGCDSAHFELAEDLIRSIRVVSGSSYSIGFVRFCNAVLPESIESQVDLVVSASDEYTEFNLASGFYTAFGRIKPRIPMLFPGFKIYTWIDADCWIQSERALKKFERLSNSFDVCIHPELDIHYFRLPIPTDRTISFYQNAMPKRIDPNIMRKPMFNTGVVSARSGSKIWGMWEDALVELRLRFERGESSFFSDQIPLHYLLHTEDVSIFPLPATDNWQTYACAPGFDVHSRKLCTPTFPHREINIIHLAGHTKDSYFEFAGKRTRLRYRDFMQTMQSVLS